MRIAFIMSRRDPSLPTIDNDGGVVLLLGYGNALAALGHTVDIFTSRANEGWGIPEYVSRKRSLQTDDIVELSHGVRVIRKEVAPIEIREEADLNSDSHVILSSVFFADSFDSELMGYDIVNFFHPTSAYGLLSQNKVVADGTVLFPMLLSTEYAKFKNITQKYLDMEMKVLTESAYIFSSSPFEVEELKALGVHMAKVRVLARGFDTNVFKHKQRANLSHSKPIQIVSVGAIRPQKRQDMLVDIAIELDRRGIDAQINIVGDNLNFSYAKNKDYYNSVANRISRLNLDDKIQFVGGKSPQELSEILQNSDIAVFPSVAESFGKAALETISCGIPTIAAKSVEAYNIFMNDRINALMVEPLVLEYANAIESLYTNDELYASFSTAGVAQSEQFSWVAVTRQLERLYLEVKNQRNNNKRMAHAYSQ